MHFKLIIAFVDDRHTEEVVRAARQSGATGITLLPSARGEGIEPVKTFLGLSLEARRDVLVLVVEDGDEYITNLSTLNFAEPTIEDLNDAAETALRT